MVNLPFLKKKQPSVIPGRGTIPTDRVREMAARGFSEPEMIDVLRREGYSPEEIDRALTTALHMSVAGEPTVSTQPVQQPFPNTTYANQNTMPNLTPTLAPPTQQQQQETTLPQIPETSLPEEYYSDYSAEDYIDYALQNKMSEVNSRLEEMEENQKRLSSKVEEFSKKIEAVANKSKAMPAEFSDNIQQFNERVTDIEARLGSLEKAFKETLPALIEGVKTLSDLVQKNKKES